MQISDTSISTRLSPCRPPSSFAKPIDRAGLTWSRQPSESHRAGCAFTYLLTWRAESKTAMSNFVTPGQQRYLRACMVCSIVMTYAVRVSKSFCPKI